MTSVLQPGSSSPQPVSKWEWWAILGVAIVAATFRFSYPGRLAVEHFDEGVYASNIWFSDAPGGVYPEQHLYAPPLLPALIEWIFVFLGPSNWGAILPSQVAGTATVILLWWIGRRWFGHVAGLTAATLCAVNEVHILLSRSALTDALLAMWWVGSLIALRRACDSGRWSHALLAGYLVGMAWYSKYNGWMPLAITIAAVIARAVCCRDVWLQSKTALKSCLIATITALVVWSPWLWSLQSKGGYASVMANHRQYVAGLSGWPASFLRQWEQLSALSGQIALTAILGTYAAILWIATRRNAAADSSAAPSMVEDQTEAHPILVRPLFGVVGEMLTSATIIWGLLSPVICYAILPVQSLALWWFLPRDQAGVTDVRSRTDLGHWILLAWFGGLFLATPLYHPYLRLSLPWLISAFLGVGLAFQYAWTATSLLKLLIVRDPKIAQRLRYRVLGLLVIAGLIGVKPILSGRLLPDLVPITNHLAFEGMSRQVAGTINPDRGQARVDDVPTAVYVYAEPGFIFQLRAAGLSNVGPVGSLQFMSRQFSGPDQKVYLVIGVHAKADPHVMEQLRGGKGQLKYVGSWEWYLGPLVALDQPTTNPKFLGLGPHDRTTIDLYEVRRP